MNILFWNLNKNDNWKYINDCLFENKIDIAVFSEYNKLSINKLRMDNYCMTDKLSSEHIIILYKKTMKKYHINYGNRYVLIHFEYKNIDYLFVGLHLYDRKNYAANQRIELIQSIMSDIVKCEIDYNCKNTIVVGDFNCNPYDDEITQVNAFNAVLFKELIIQKDNVKHLGKKIDRFYNPIINCIREKTKMYGSFYFNNSFSGIIWNSLDQILIRKKLVKGFKTMKYIKRINNESLMNKCIPKKRISDHLPLFAKIK